MARWPSGYGVTFRLHDAITFRNSKERGFDPHPCQCVFALVGYLSLCYCVLRGGFAPGNGGAKATHGWAEAHPKLISSFYPTLNPARAWRSELNPG